MIKFLFPFYLFEWWIACGESDERRQATLHAHYKIHSTKWNKEKLVQQQFDSVTWTPMDHRSFRCNCNFVFARHCINTGVSSFSTSLFPIFERKHENVNSFLDACIREWAGAHWAFIHWTCAGNNVFARIFYLPVAAAAASWGIRTIYLHVQPKPRAEAWIEWGACERIVSHTEILLYFIHHLFMQSFLCRYHRAITSNPSFVPTNTHTHPRFINIHIYRKSCTEIQCIFYAPLRTTNDVWEAKEEEHVNDFSCTHRCSDISERRAAARPNVRWSAYIREHRKHVLRAECST